MKVVKSTALLAGLMLACTAQAGAPGKGTPRTTATTTPAAAAQQAVQRGSQLTIEQQQALRDSANAMPRANAKPMPATRRQAELTKRTQRDGSVSAQTSVDMMLNVVAEQAADGTITVTHEGDATTEGNDHE